MTPHDALRLFAKTLENLERWMDKAAEHAKARGFELDGKDAAPSGDGVHEDLMAQYVGEPPDDRQAEPGAAPSLARVVV